MLSETVKVVELEFKNLNKQTKKGNKDEHR